MSQIRTVIREIINTHAENGTTVSPALIEAEVRDMHSDVFADYSVQLAAKGVRDTARDMLTSAARNKQQPFEGMELPSWFTRPDGEGAYDFVPLASATLRDHSADMEVKRKNVDDATAELRIAEDREAMLRSAPGADDDMLVLAAAKAVAP